MTAALPMGNNKITGLATPTLATDAVTKAYADTLPIQDKAVTLQKLYHPTATSRLLGSDSNPALTITGAANNGSGLIRLLVASTATFLTGQVKTVSDVVGTTEANGTWTITVVDATHIDLQGSAFVSAYSSGGTIGGGVEEISLGSGLTLTGSVLSATVGPDLLPGYLSGLTISVASGSTSFQVATGVANDVTSGGLMRLLSTTTKTTSAWAVGSGNGGLDTGTIAVSTWYHVHEIKRPDTGVVDVLFSTSASAPTMPANYTLRRRIGSVKTDGASQFIGYTQTGDDFIWLTSVVDFSGASTTSRVSKVLGVPTGVVVAARFRAGLIIGAGSAGCIFTSLQENDQAPVIGALGDLSGPANGFTNGSFERLTDTSAQIGVRSQNTGYTVTIETYGWKDTRGQ
jgi:hypothetical protein